MKSPQTTDYIFNNHRTVNALNEYTQALNNYIDHLESLKVIPSEELRVTIRELIYHNCEGIKESSDEITYVDGLQVELFITKLLELLQPKQEIVFPSDEEIEILFPSEDGQTITMENETTYGQMLLNNYQRRIGAKNMITKIKELNNIS